MERERHEAFFENISRTMTKQESYNDDDHNIPSKVINVLENCHKQGSFTSTSELIAMVTTCVSGMKSCHHNRIFPSCPSPLCHNGFRVQPLFCLFCSESISVEDLNEKSQHAR